jgi:peptidoglycan/xylan/chitin deacetylase (PgdA/CDA1 family)
LLAALAFWSAGVLGCRTINGSRDRLGLPEGVVIFSFDDGPNHFEDTTVRLLETLEKYEIQALFVLLGENSAANPDVVRAIAQKGHLIGSHGYSGKWAVWMDEKRFRDNLIRWEDAIGAALGEEPQIRFYRPHGGFYTARQERIWRDAGYALVPVTARAYDAVLGEARREKAVSAIVAAVEKQRGGVILLHDARDSLAVAEKRLAQDPVGPFNRSWIPGAVEEIILILEAKGFKLRGFDLFSILGAIR